PSTDLRDDSPIPASMIAPIRQPLFDLGMIVSTAAALKAIQDSGQEPADFVNRHAFGDWGTVFAEEKERNDHAVTAGGKIVSEYRTGNGIKIRIVTAPADADGRRATTTILLPSEHQ